MKLTIHRGTKQIGGNILEVATETTRIILDCGKNLPPLDGTYGGDDIHIDGLTGGESSYDAVFVTHYHADHCGLLARVNKDIPIYASNETASVLGTIADFTRTAPPRITQALKPGAAVLVGDITLVPIPVQHSANGAMMFLVKANEKKLLYTGDFHDMDETYFSLLEHVDALVCEGTNVGARSNITEEGITRRAAEIMRNSNQNVFVLCSATNLPRIHAMEKACIKTKRKMAFDPFMMAITKRVGHIRTKPVGFTSYWIEAEKSPKIHRYFTEDISLYTDASSISQMQDLAIFVRPTMGEFMSRLNDHKPLAGSTLLYSMWKGYQSKPPVAEFLQLCKGMDMEIVELHTSGHAYREMLEKAIARLKPEVVVPIHTESAESFCEMHSNVMLLNDTLLCEDKPASVKSTNNSPKATTSYFILLASPYSCISAANSAPILS